MNEIQAEEDIELKKNEKIYKIHNYIDGDKVELEVLCKRDGGSDIENILDEEGKKIVKEHQLSLGKPVLEKKIETTKIKLATLEKVQREI